jgi:hypothetical protein
MKMIRCFTYCNFYSMSVNVITVLVDGSVRSVVRAVCAVMCMTRFLVIPGVWVRGVMMCGWELGKECHNSLRS